MTKTDNHNLKVKLDLRRYFLKKYHADGCAVFDCCQGSGAIWSALRQEFDVRSYWGVDQKKKKGRLRIDSARVLETGLIEDVIDIDTYGAPWTHWQNLLRIRETPVTVFLTIGQVLMGTSTLAFEAVGLGKMRRRIPASFGRFIGDLAVSSLLTTSCKKDIFPVEIVEALSDGNARYIGVRLEKKEKPESDVSGHSTSRLKET